jgi:putative serine protease PepD
VVISLRGDEMVVRAVGLTAAGVLAVAVLAVAVLAVAVLAVAVLAGCASSGSDSTGSTDLQSQYVSVSGGVLPSVVQISTSSSTGSGVVFDSRGDIVTNAHVVSGASTVKLVRASDGHTYNGRVIGMSSANDIAVVRVTGDASSLHPAPFDTGATGTGQIVLAMGSPLGLTGTVTQGINRRARDPEAGAAPGIGFAIPASTAKSVADKIIAAAG